MKHALWISVVGIALAGVVVGGVAMMDRSPASVTISLPPPVVEYDEFDGETAVRCDLPVYKSDGSRSVFVMYHLSDGQLESGQPEKFTIESDAVAVTDIPGIILLPSGERFTAEYGNSLSGRFSVSVARSLLEAGSARMKWDSSEYEIREDGIDQLRAFLVELDKLKAN